MPLKPAKKKAYFAQLKDLVNEYTTVLVISIDNVGSKQFALVRQALRGKAVIMGGKNTMMRTCLKDEIEKENLTALKELIPLIHGNVGLVFCMAEISEIRQVILDNFVPAAARAGAVAPCNVKVMAGPTGLEPGQTNFFQALNIATKIVKGQIEIVSDVDLIQEGSRVGASQAALLQKLGRFPFKYGVLVKHVYQNGVAYAPEALDITDDDLARKFGAASRNMAAFSRELGIPTAASLPHGIMAAFKNVIALSLGTDTEFEEMESVKQLLQAAA
eukprot:Filipodium_phascolosomae@DN1100_c0_g1_i1.p1